MKKILLLLIALSGINGANAMLSADSCLLLSPTGSKTTSLFYSPDNKLEAIFYYNISEGHEISGVFSAVLPDEGKYKYTSPLKNSYCENGIIKLRMNTRSLAGYLIGTIDIKAKAIINVHGDLNGQPISTILYLKEYR